MASNLIIFSILSICFIAIQSNDPAKYHQLRLLRNKFESFSRIITKNYQDLSENLALDDTSNVANAPPISNPDKRATPIKFVVTQLSTGKMVGLEVETNKSTRGEIYLGVPYAQIPQGNLRYAKPELPKPWKEIYNATYYRAACPQNASFPTTEGWISEDCLQLNIFKPGYCTTTTPCPVIYYIHGGQYNYDTPVAFPIDAIIDNFVRNGVAMITVGMRLGTQGFWTTGDDRALGNWGIHDAILGLEWVKTEGPNMHLDTNRVTLMGHSSGADIISLLSVSPKVKGLFHRLIAMSGSAIQPSGIENDGSSILNSETLATRLGCSGHQNDSMATLQCMRSLNWEHILHAQKQMELEGMSLPGVRVDGPNGLFPYDSLDMAQRRQPYSLMIGTNKHEFGALFPFVEVSQEAVESLCGTILANFHYTENLDILTKFCVSSYAQYSDNYSFQAEQVLNNMLLNIGVFKDAASMSEVKGDVFLYEFEFARTGLEKISPWHAMDLTYLMGLHPFKYDARDEAIADIYVPLFYNFAKFGNPTPTDSNLTTSWAKMDIDLENYYYIDLPNPRNVNGYHEKSVTLWLETIPNLAYQLSNGKIESKFRLSYSKSPNINDIMVLKGVPTIKEVEKNEPIAPAIINSNPIANPDKRAQVLDSVEINLSTGTIIGSEVMTNKSIVANMFLGVPYAQIPTGNMRFAKPKPALPRSEVYNATYYRAACPQNASFPTTEGWISEDCLHMNIFQPTTCTPVSPCPIIYYIHGGGSYDTPVAFPIDSLIDNFVGHGVSIITVGMRLGTFGFWTTGDESALGNWGLHDTILGLQWMQQEAKNLHLDPTKVTLMGHSAGGVMVSLLSISQQTEGLFHQLIEMSGSGIQPGELDTIGSVKSSLTLAERIGCVNDDATAKHTAIVLECMQKQSWQSILHAQKQMEMDGLSLPGVIKDGPQGLLSTNPVDLSKSRRPLRLLIGTNKHEGGQFPMLGIENVTEDTIKTLCSLGLELFGYIENKSTLTDKCQSEYAKFSDDYKKQGEEIINALQIHLATLIDSMSMEKSGAKVYLYEFEFGRTGLEQISPWHAMDLTYVLGLHPFEYDERDEAIARIYVPIFANFAKFGNPTPVKTSTQDQWETFNPSLNNFYSINLPQPQNHKNYHTLSTNLWLKTIPELDQHLKQTKDTSNLQNPNPESPVPNPQIQQLLEISEWENTNTTENETTTILKAMTTTKIPASLDYETAFWITLVVALVILAAFITSLILNKCAKRKEEAVMRSLQRRHTLQPSEKTHLLSGGSQQS